MISMTYNLLQSNTSTLVLAHILGNGQNRKSERKTCSASILTDTFPQWYAIIYFCKRKHGPTYHTNLSRMVLIIYMLMHISTLVDDQKLSDDEIPPECNQLVIHCNITESVPERNICHSIWGRRNLIKIFIFIFWKRRTVIDDPCHFISIIDIQLSISLPWLGRHRGKEISLSRHFGAYCE